MPSLKAFASFSNLFAGGVGVAGLAGAAGLVGAAGSAVGALAGPALGATAGLGGEATDFLLASTDLISAFAFSFLASTALS